MSNSSSVVLSFAVRIWYRLVCSIHRISAMGKGRIEWTDLGCCFVYSSCFHLIKGHSLRRSFVLHVLNYITYFVFNRTILGLIGRSLEDIKMSRPIPCFYCLIHNRCKVCPEIIMHYYSVFISAWNKSCFYAIANSITILGIIFSSSATHSSHINPSSWPSNTSL